MSDSIPGDLTPEGLVEALADAGEFDAGVEVLDLLRARDPEFSGLVKLQARLFASASPNAERRRKVIETLRRQGVDALARHGALAECVVACRVLALAFPEDPVWANRRDRFALVTTPLGGSHGDPRRAQVDHLVATGALAEAHGILRDLARDDPSDKTLPLRVDILRGLLFDPAHTRPYRAVPTSDAARILSGAAKGASVAPPKPSETPPPMTDTWSADDTTTPDSLHDTTPAPGGEGSPGGSIAPAPGSDVSLKRRKIVRLE